MSRSPEQEAKWLEFKEIMGFVAADVFAGVSGLEKGTVRVTVNNDSPRLIDVDGDNITKRDQDNLPKPTQTP